MKDIERLREQQNNSKTERQTEIQKKDREEKTEGQIG